MPHRVALRAGVVVAVVLVLTGAALVAWRLLAPTSPLVRAMALAPADTTRFSWTDWEGVRRELGAEVGARSSAEEVDAFLTEAFDADLSSMSALGTSAGAMQAELGVSPATISWELLAQSGAGAVEVMGVGDADLAGPAPGQGGDFADRFSLEEAGAEGREVVLDLRPTDGGYVLSDLTSGPVLFATC